MPRHPENPRQRPLQARALATRQKLLDATVAALVELGYGRTTTTVICERAGVSQGALFKHYPTKVELLCAAAEHLFEALIDEFRAAFERAAAEEGDLVSNAVRVLERTFQRDALQAAFELYVAARTEPELGRALAPVLGQHRANLRREARALFPQAAAQNPAFEPFVDLVMDVMQGRALTAGLGLDPAETVRSLVLLYRIARRELDTNALSEQGNASARAEA